MALRLNVTNYVACRAFAQVLRRSLSLSKPRHAIDIANETDFKQRVLGSKKPVVVDFHAEWCQPCKMLGPVLEKAVESRGGRIELAKVNIDNLPDLAMEYQVTVVPTVIAMKNGVGGANFTGVQSKQFIDKFLDSLEKR